MNTFNKTVQNKNMKWCTMILKINYTNLKINLFLHKIIIIYNNNLLINLIKKLNNSLIKIKFLIIITINYNNS